MEETFESSAAVKEHKKDTFNYVILVLVKILLQENSKFNMEMFIYMLLHALYVPWQKCLRRKSRYDDRDERY